MTRIRKKKSLPVIGQSEYSKDESSLDELHLVV